MVADIPLRCAFVASRSTRRQLATAVTRHVTVQPRSLASTGAVLVLGVVVFVLMGHDVGRAVLLAVLVTLAAAVVEGLRAWVAAYRSLRVVGVPGALTRSGFASDRLRLSSEAGDEVHPFDELADVETHGQAVFLRLHESGQRWFVHPRALFPDTELDRMRAAIGRGPVSGPRQ